MQTVKKSSVILIFNSAGELALQLRAVSDDSYPLHWDFSAAGGIDDKENAEEAASRELKEELGISAVITPLEKIECTYTNWQSPQTTTEELYIFEAHHNGPFTPDSQEVERVVFFNLQTIQHMIENKEKFHPEFLDIWESGIIQEAASNKT